MVDLSMRNYTHSSADGHVTSVVGGMPIFSGTCCFTISLKDHEPLPGMDYSIYTECDTLPYELLLKQKGF